MSFVVKCRYSLMFLAMALRENALVANEDIMQQLPSLQNFYLGLTDGLQKLRTGKDFLTFGLLLLRDAVGS